MSMTFLILLAIAAVVVYLLWQQRNKAPDVVSAAGGPVPAASYEAYRRQHPSHMVYGKLTCQHCGSNLIRREQGVARCESCSAALYRIG